MKKLLMLLLISVILFFPPVSVYFAMQEAARMQTDAFEEERARVIASRLEELAMPMSSDSQFQMNVSRLARKVILDGKQAEEYYSLRARSADASIFFQEIASELLDKVDYPCEIAFMFRLSEDRRHFRTFRYGTRLGIEAILQNFSKNTIVDKNPLWTGYFAATLEEEAGSLISSTIIPFRSKNGMRVIFGKSLNPEIYLLALADLHPISWLKSLKNKIRNAKEDYGTGCLPAGTGQPVFSPWFDKKDSLRARLTKFIAKAGPTSETVDIDGCRLYLAAIDQRSETRLFAVAGPVAADSANRRTGKFLVIILAAISTLLFIMIGQKIMLNRGFDLKIRFLIPLIFLMLFIQPLFSMIYLANEYLQTSYNNIQSATSEKLSGELNDLDQQTNDNFLNRLNLVRTFDSIERISSYTHEPYTGSDDFNYCITLLQTLDRQLLSRYFTSLWMCRDDGEFVAVSMRDDDQYRAESKESDFTGFFNDRFVEILDYHNNHGKVITRHGGHHIQDDLKGEYSRDFFLQLFGPDIFFNFRRYFPMYLDIRTTYKKNKLFGMPIRWGNRFHAYITWHMDEKNAVHDFPLRFLDLNSRSPRLAIWGNERSTDTLKYALEETEARRPHLLSLAKNSHFNRAQTAGVEKLDETITIRQAFPCNYSFYTVAGSETIASFAAYRKDLEKKTLFFLAALALLSFALAMAGARYFTRPLRELTDATYQITAGNYQIEISQNHPDEFAEIGAAFNRIAAGLREGNLLKGFVSESVRREIVAGQEIDELAKRSELRNATIIFAGICDFASFQSNHDEHQIFELLQSLLQASDEATRIYGGEIDKMIEDKIMIVFEQNNENPDYQTNAIRTAMKISDLVFARTGHHVAAGVNTGVVVAGIMGAAEARLSRTVVGDPVNLSARLASLAGKRPDGGVIISGILIDAIPAGISCEKLPISSVKGKTQAVEAYEVRKVEHAQP
ncbi:MAG: adenylate/guanylate cyclase domain-containing protein [Candidatus Riflebacteria bacterium]|nr:adenylate/guanylate cyclase domain-containing protein [Candidatus Riflebacteria bacterium]